MRKFKIGEATEGAAFIEDEQGYDIAILTRLQPKAKVVEADGEDTKLPYCEDGRELNDSAWQGLINSVCEAAQKVEPDLTDQFRELRKQWEDGMSVILEYDKDDWRLIVLLYDDNNKYHINRYFKMGATAMGDGDTFMYVEGKWAVSVDVSNCDSLPDAINDYAAICKGTFNPRAR